jgi:hypothetical protein
MGPILQQPLQHEPGERGLRERKKQVNLKKLLLLYIEADIRDPSASNLFNVNQAAED